MYAQEDQDGTCAVTLRLLNRREQRANDVPIDKKDRRISARVPGPGGSAFCCGERVW